MQTTVEQISLTLREPLVSASATIERRELILISMKDENGRVGWGEAAPLEPFDGVSDKRCLEAVERQLSAIRALPKGASGAELLEAARNANPLPQALAAIDTALWDLAGQRDRAPLATLLAANPLAQVAVNALVGADAPQSAAAQAKVAVAAGFTTLKVKVGGEDDVERLEAIREAVGPTIAIRIDANGTWTVDQAQAALLAFDRFAIELAEEPVSGLQQVRELRARVNTPIAIDETSAQDGALSSGAADIVCLKLGRAGGVSALLAQAALVRRSGAEVYLASTLDGPVGIAAALHVAAALRIEIPCGLATLDRFERFAEGSLTPRAGAIKLPLGPGLGVGPTEA